MYHYPHFPTSGIQRLDWTVEVLTDPSPDRYFWAHQFTILRDNQQSPTGGYVGLQTIASGIEGRAAIFSMWATTAVSPGVGKYGKVIAGPFSGEGSGHQCLIAFPWQVGVAHKLSLSRLADGRWTATADGTPIGFITPPTTGWNDHVEPDTVLFTERWTGDPNSIRKSRVRFADLSATGTDRKRVLMDRYTSNIEAGTHQEIDLEQCAGY